MNCLQENKMSKNEILKHITKTKINSIELFQNIFVNTENTINEMKILKTQEELQLYNLYLIKSYLFNECIYGMLHVQVKYFKKARDYKRHIILIKEKIKKTLEISNTSNKNEAFVLIDLRGMTAKQFSRKFVKLMAETLDEYPDDILKTCYVYGNTTFIKVMWPLIRAFVKKETREKLVLLN
jgi:hypothetical protein